jgi:hypothetical protein
MWHFSNTDSEGRQGWRFWSAAGARLSNLGTSIGSGSLSVKETDGAPNVSGVTIIQVTNGTLTDDGGGQVSLDLSGSGGVATGIGRTFMLMGA